MNKNSTVYILADEFRDAVERALNKGEFENDVVMKSFPWGCCGDMSDLLGEYLLNNSVENLWYVCGNHYPDSGDLEYDFEYIQSHAWLSIGQPNCEGSLIVDITGDQFCNSIEYQKYNERVYVGEMDMFHSLFDVEPRDCRRFLGISNYSFEVQVRLYKIYNIVIQNLRV